MNILLRWLITTLAVLIASYILPGVSVDGFLAALIAAAVLGIVNVIIKPILIVLTLPITIVTFGLFLLVINALMIMLASTVVPGFFVAGFWWAVLFSIVLSLLSYLLHQPFKEAE
ncbi:MAG: phage holin family protein [Candidatus Andersenbacteria bacterium]